MPKWCVFVRPSTCVCGMYVHRIIMSACVWVLLLGAFTLLSVYCSCCHRMPLPAELYQQDVGEVENYFFLLWCRCSLNLFTGFREEKKKKKSNLAAIHCVNVYLHACVCFSLHRQGQQMSFITVKMPNKLSTPPCLLWRHLRSRTHARVKQAGGVAQTRSTGRSDTVNILLPWNGRTWHLNEMHHLLSKASW